MPLDRDYNVSEIMQRIVSLDRTFERLARRVAICDQRLQPAEKRIADLEVAMKRLERLTGNYTLVKDSGEDWETSALKECEEQETE